MGQLKIKTNENIYLENENIETNSEQSVRFYENNRSFLETQSKKSLHFEWMAVSLGNCNRTVYAKI